MRSHRPSPEHQEAVSRRLALLSAELTSVREDDGLGDPTSGDGLTGGQPVDRWVAPATHTRVRADRWEASGPEPDPRPRPVPPDPTVPVPGRHAHRRPGPRLVDLVPSSWRGRLALGPGQLTLVALAVVVGVVVTGWWLVRGSPTEVVAPGPGDLAPVLASPPAGGSGSASPLLGASGEPTTDLVVDVAGKVRRPGIAVLEPGSRVVDALEAAGGTRPGVDLSALNLARQLVDGEQILVGLEPVAGTAAGLVTSPTDPSGGPLVSLNVADQTLLETLPDVGPVTAHAIIAWRDEHGGFTAVDELLEVDGIGETTLGRLAPLVTL